MLLKKSTVSFLLLKNLSKIENWLCMKCFPKAAVRVITHLFCGFCEGNVFCGNEMLCRFNSLLCHFFSKGVSGIFYNQPFGLL